MESVSTSVTHASAYIMEILSTQFFVLVILKLRNLSISQNKIIVRNETE